MEPFSTLLVVCARNSLVICEFPSQTPGMLSFDAFFDLCLNKQLGKHLRCRWFETPTHSFWHHCNGNGYLQHWMARASLNGHFLKNDTGIKLTAKFITMEPLKFFNKSSPGDFSATPIGTSTSWVTCLTYINEEVGRKLNRYIIHQCQGTVGPATLVWR